MVQAIDTLRVKQKRNGHTFADDTFGPNVSYDAHCNLIKISVELFPRAPPPPQKKKKKKNQQQKNSKPELVQVMAWHPTDNKPWSKPWMPSFTDAYMRLSAWMC